MKENCSRGHQKVISKLLIFESNLKENCSIGPIVEHFGAPQNLPAALENWSQKCYKSTLLYHTIVSFEWLLLRFVGLQNGTKWDLGALWSTAKSTSSRSKLSWNVFKMRTFVPWNCEFWMASVRLGGARKGSKMRFWGSYDWGLAILRCASKNSTLPPLTTP